MDLRDPQQIHGYAYSHNNPATFSDPTGLYDVGDEEGKLTSKTRPDGKTRVIEDKRHKDKKKHTKQIRKIKKAPNTPKCNSANACERQPSAGGGGGGGGGGPAGPAWGQLLSNALLAAAIGGPAPSPSPFAVGGAICSDDKVACALFGLEGASAVGAAGVTVVVVGQIWRDTAGDGIHNPVMEAVGAIKEWF